MKKIIILSFAIVFFAILAQPALADIVFPTETEVFFSQNGESVNQPIDYTVTCYGYSWDPGLDPEKEPGSYTPEEVYSYTASCPEYGCKIDEMYYLNYRHINYCDLTGTTNSIEFTIENFGDEPVNSDNCRDSLIGAYVGESGEEGIEQYCKQYFEIPADVDLSWAEGRTIIGVPTDNWLTRMWCFIKRVLKLDNQCLNG